MQPVLHRWQAGARGLHRQCAQEVAVSCLVRDARVVQAQLGYGSPDGTVCSGKGADTVYCAYSL